MELTPEGKALLREMEECVELRVSRRDADGTRVKVLERRSRPEWVTNFAIRSWIYIH